VSESLFPDSVFRSQAPREGFGPFGEEDGECIEVSCWYKKERAGFKFNPSPLNKFFIIFIYPIFRN